MGLAEVGIPEDLRRDILARVPTHATLLSRERWFSFLHDMFLNFFLGARLAVLMGRGERNAVRDALASRELTPQIVEWLYLALDGAALGRRGLIDLLSAILQEGAEGTASLNAGRISAAILREWSDGARIVLEGQTFSGETLRNGTYSRVTFRKCSFWEIDLSGGRFEDCVFDSCNFGDVLIDRKCSMRGCRLTQTRIANLDVVDERSLYAPDEVSKFLSDLGAIVDVPVATPIRPAPPRRIKPDVVRCLEKFVKASNRTTDVAVEDIEELCGPVARTVAKIGLKNDVLREVNKSVSGPRKTFVRFRVDKNKALRGQGGATGDSSVDRFWDEIENKFQG
jgi:hypothetical protein